MIPKMEPDDYVEIYKKLFATGSYANHRNTEYRYEQCRLLLMDEPGTTLLDIGSGRGIICSIFTALGKECIGLDIENFGGNPNFIPCNLKTDSSILGMLRIDMFACLDVLEHFTEDVVEKILFNMRQVSPVGVITVSNHSDVLLGTELHLTQQGFDWWMALMETHFDVVKASTKTYESGAETYTFKVRQKFFYLIR